MSSSPAVFPGPVEISCLAVSTFTAVALVSLPSVPAATPLTCEFTFLCGLVLCHFFLCSTSRPGSFRVKIMSLHNICPSIPRECLTFCLVGSFFLISICFLGKWRLLDITHYLFSEFYFIDTSTWPSFISGMTQQLLYRSLYVILNEYLGILGEEKIWM